MTTTLTQGQKAAADGFFDFLMSGEKTFGISGSAGVGKTFLMAHIASDVMKIYENACQMIGVEPQFSQVHFTATTNKAAEVLSESLGVDVKTIHSFLGLKVRENWKTGKSFLEKTNNWKIRRNAIVFIDECSMIDTALYSIILESFEDSKIVFVGDHAQMAPIEETISPLYLDLPDTNLATLTQPVRNAGAPALVQLCTQLRDTVETGVFSPIEEVPGTIDYIDDDQMVEALNHYFSDPDPSCRVLCYTNRRVQQYNEYIREDVRKLPLDLCEGDVVVVAQAYMSGKTSLSVERELVIKSLSPVHHCTDYQDVLGETIPYRSATLATPDGRETYQDIRVPMDRNQVDEAIKKYSRLKFWSEYFELKQTFADLRDKAACTVYKAQGSTYDAVIIDIGNIGTSRSAEQVARMLFVAGSRARTRIFLYGNLPPHYHNSQGSPLWKDESMSAA